MTLFDQQLLRLKQALGTPEDQAVAQLLGMTKAAFAARKARGAFPGDKVAALAVAKPGLRLDVPWVLTGTTAQAAAVQAAAKVVDSYRPQVAEPQASGYVAVTSVALSADEMRLIDLLRSCSVAERLAVENIAARLATLRRLLDTQQPHAASAPDKRR